jgi:hypothetical protein
LIWESASQELPNNLEFPKNLLLNGHTPSNGMTSRPSTPFSSPHSSNIFRPPLKPIDGYGFFQQGAFKPRQMRREFGRTIPMRRHAIMSLKWNVKQVAMGRWTHVANLLGDWRKKESVKSEN